MDKADNTRLRLVILSITHLKLFFTDLIINPS